MTNREFTATRTMLANAMATAGAELLEYMGTAGALAAIPNTDPPQYVVAGTLQIIAKLLPSVDAAPAVQAQAELTDERIAELNREAQDQAITGLPPSIYFARAIERELRSGSSDVRAQALEEAAKACEARIQNPNPSEWDWSHDAPYDAEDRACAAAIRALKSAAPAASKEGGE
jgi:hypothetical protein